MRRKPELLRVGVDTGGTFTDLVLLGPKGSLKVAKVPSTPGDPSLAVLRGLTELGVMKDTTRVIHGTTVATNAFLQRKGGRTALVTTAGFEDVLSIGRQARSHLYRLDPPPRKAWLPDSLRVGLRERIGPRGEIWQSLHLRDLSHLKRRLRRLRPQAVAVCLLHSYANPSHERAVARALRGEGWHLSLSHRIANEFREYERTCTTVANATLVGPMKSYLERLGSRVGRGRLRVMASSGGWLGYRRAASEPVRTILSGPAGGALAAALLGKAAGFSRLLTLDMGGTSTDVSLCQGEVSRVHGINLDGVPLRIPCLDIRSVGAGGGSVARLDPGGALRVGPESAGADPGPACYGKGGARPTLTDAHLVLGRLSPEGLLGGAVPLDPSRARSVLGRLARQARLPLERLALGVLRVGDATLERAVRSISAGRGHNPAGFALLVFGGAGGLHACALARSLGIRRILVPRDPGTFSALGLCSSPATSEASRTVLVKAKELDPTRVARFVAPLEETARRTLLKEGHERSELISVREADLRYAGQSHELTLPIRDRLVADFHRAHRSEFGYQRLGDEIELVTVRARVVAPGPRFRLRRRQPVPRSARPRELVSAVLESGRRARVPLYHREDLEPGHFLKGPAVVSEYSATTWISGDFALIVDALGNLLLTTKAGGK